ncbi:molybdopterin-dependent oxidoreductase [Nocardia sp. NBC_01730]|uniref:molybdopterin-dependent oxidoreductase n=1 Tax=Nocardia sp. NBC_01730 TaxID=2975998 RepID=UPI002E1531A8|nr:molybdopterin-dependent oxidoreductase [Nocardia sp. NBC_01730]
MAELRLRVVAGIVSAGLTLGVAELVAAFADARSAPLNALGSVVVDHTSDSLREWAIDTFGTDDKSALYLIMGVVALVVAGLAGVIERPSRATGSWLLAAFGVIAAAAAVARTSVSGALPTVIGVSVGIYALRVLTRRIERTAEAEESSAFERRDHRTPDTGSESGRPSDEAAPPASAARVPAASSTTAVDAAQRAAAPERRQVLQGLLVTGGAAVVTGFGGRLLSARRRDVSGERAAVRLPEPSAPVQPLAPGVDLRVPGSTPYLTANDDFYRIDTALIVPQVSKDSWSLRIHGMVDHEIELTWADLANRPVEERLVTLACVSNPVGGDLIGNARWLGYRLDQLLAEAGPHADADMALSHSTDGWTAGSPLSVLTDGRDALLAIGMNGEPLPVQHGYPARLVVPGLYGYVSATKWVTELEVTRFDRATAYWTRRGWSALGPIKTGTRIDTPRARGRIEPGRIPIAGVAWAQHRGIRGVEVQIDNGAWQQARLADEQSVDTWRQWVFDWDATTGPHTIRARATDGTGETQTAERSDVVPDGATGYPTVTIQVG